MNENDKQTLRKINEDAQKYAMSQLSQQEAGLVGLAPIIMVLMVALAVYFGWDML